ncbi:MAG: hypothetical protein ABEI52_02530, partial [Halobacteriaceae archaeon]
DLFDDFVWDCSGFEGLFDPLFQDFLELMSVVGVEPECLAVQTSLAAWREDDNELYDYLKNNWKIMKIHAEKSVT